MSVKKLVLTVSLIAITASSYASFNLRLLGGLSLTKLDNKDLIVLDQKADPNYAFSAKLSKDLLKLEVGLGVDVLGISAKGMGNTRMIYAKPGIPVYGFINRKHKLPKLDLYYGLALGYMFNKGTTAEVHLGRFSLPRNSGVTGGIQMGATVNITKSFGISAEGAARYARLGYDVTLTNSAGDSKVVREHYNIFYFPVLVGVQIAF